MDRGKSVLFCYAYSYRCKRHTATILGDNVSPPGRSKADSPPAGVSRAVQGDRQHQPAPRPETVAAARDIFTHCTITGHPPTVPSPWSVLIHLLFTGL